MYDEIKELYEYCKELKIPCRLEPLYDGYKLVLPDGGDFVQHSFSWVQRMDELNLLSVVMLITLLVPYLWQKG